MALATLDTDRTKGIALSVLQRLFGDHPRRDFAVRLWDGSGLDPAPGQPARCTVVFRHPSALRTLLLEPNDLALGEAFVHRDFDIEGDIIAGFELAAYLMRQKRTLVEKLGLGLAALRLPADADTHGLPAPRLGGPRHSRQRDRAAIAYHYDLSNAFYQQFLDEQLVYSCAYFRDPGDDLETAQRQKLELVCRKLRLRPGERLLDLGCGWGALVLHAARQHGAIARGVTLSREQARWAQDRIRALGLQDRCRVEQLDWREVESPEGFDKIACVGMFEHVGARKLRECLRHTYSLLAPGGLFLNHGITVSATNAETAGSTFLRKYVFPDGELLPISRILTAAERAGFEVRDVESLREHYVLTLRHWVRRLESNRDEALRQVDDVHYRIWWIYLAGCVVAFQNNNINLHQTLFAKPLPNGDSRLPLTREDLYRQG